MIVQLISAQSQDVLTIRKYREQNAGNIINEFVNFLAIPNLAKDTINILKNPDFIMQMMQKRGIQNIQLLNPVTLATPPAVYGEVNVPGAKQTLIFYAHYDGQPVNPTQWQKGLSHLPQSYLLQRLITMAAQFHFQQMATITRNGEYMPAVHRMIKPV